MRTKGETLKMKGYGKTGNCAGRAGGAEGEGDEGR